MARYEIPLTPQPQNFTITLSGTPYRLRVWWNGFVGSWTMQINDRNGNLVLACVPLVAGVDLLGQYRYLGFNGKLYAYTDANLNESPKYENLGGSGKVSWVTEDE